MENNQNQSTKDQSLTRAIEPNTISFHFTGQDTPILKLHANGDIFVKGSLAENDKEVVEAMRTFLKSQK